MSTHSEKIPATIGNPSLPPHVIAIRGQRAKSELYRIIDELLAHGNVVDLTSLLTRVFQSHITIQTLPTPDYLVKKEVKLDEDAQNLSELITFLVSLNERWKDMEAYVLPTELPTLLSSGEQDSDGEIETGIKFATSD